MLTRREFLRKSALVTAGIIAAHQLELLDRLAPRSLFPTSPILWGDGIHDDTRALEAMIQAAIDTNKRLVVLPRGTYRLTETVHLRSGRRGLPQTIDMQGSWIKGDRGVDPLVLIQPWRPDGLILAQ